MSQRYPGQIYQVRYCGAGDTGDMVADQFYYYVEPGKLEIRRDHSKIPEKIQRVRIITEAILTPSMVDTATEMTRGVFEDLMVWLLRHPETFDTAFILKTETLDDAPALYVWDLLQSGLTAFFSGFEIEFMLL